MADLAEPVLSAHSVNWNGCIYKTEWPFKVPF